MGGCTMRYKIMVVGNTISITDSVAKTLMKRNQVIRSSLLIEDFQMVFEQEDPDLVVFCLQTATMEQIAQLVKKQKEIGLLNKEIVIVGDENQRLMFKAVAVRFQPLEWSIDRDLSGLMDRIDEIMRSNPMYEELYLKRILIVDDDVRGGAYLTSILQGEYDSVLADNGIEAIHFLSSLKIDGVILSYDLESMPGKQLYTKIRSQKNAEQLPILFMTANRSKEVILDCVALKPQGLLIKPLLQKDVLEALHKVFD